MVKYVRTSRFPVIQATTEYFLSEYPLVRPYLSKVCVGVVLGDFADACGVAYPSGLIIYNEPLFSLLPWWKQRHCVLHECFHIASDYLSANGVKVVYDLAPYESPSFLISSVCTSDEETFAEIGAYWLSDRKRENVIIQSNGRLIHSALLSVCSS